MAEGTSSRDMSSRFDWEWIPNRSLGPVAFGTPIDGYLEMLDLREAQHDDFSGPPQPPHYEASGLDLNIYLEDGLVDTLISHEVFFFKGVNIIGLSKEELTELLGREPSETDEIDLSESDEEPPYLVYDYEGWGLQIWLLDDKVESASCSQY